MIAALLLAAGSSRRFGGPKLAQQLHEKAIVRWSADAARAGADALFVVVPPDHAELQAALAGLDARFVVNARAEDGMGASLACGVRALPPDCGAALVALADEPRLPADAYRRVVGAYREGANDIVAATYAGERGHPVLFDRIVFPELTALTGDQGARVVVDRVPGRVAFVDFDAPHPVDIDTPEDLARIIESPHL